MVGVSIIPYGTFWNRLRATISSCHGIIAGCIYIAGAFRLQQSIIACKLYQYGAPRGYPQSAEPGAQQRNFVSEKLKIAKLL